MVRVPGPGGGEVNATPGLLAALGTATILAFVLAIWIPTYARARAMRQRLAGFVEGGASAVDLGGQRHERGAGQAAERRSDALAWLRQQITYADADVTPPEVIVAMVVLGISVGGAVGITNGSPIVGAGAGVVAFLVPLLWLRWRAGRRHGRFVSQLPVTIELLATMVRSGNTFLQALEHVATESPEPMASALAVVVREIGLGASQEDALERLLDRFPSDDLALIVASVNVHQQTGGSLATVLDRIAETLRERIRLQGDIHAFTAMQRYSAYVLAALPVAVAGILMLVSPEYIRLLLEPGALRIAALLAAVLVIVGFFTLRRMAEIDV